MKGRNFPLSPTPDALSTKIVGFAMKVHRTLGSGFLEAVDRNALGIELRKAGIGFESHPTISVVYEGEEAGIYQADLIVEDRVIVELKAGSALSEAHATQLVNYLSATRIENGLLLNFGSRSLEFRTKARTYRPKQSIEQSSALGNLD